MSQQINLFNPLFEKQKHHFSAATMAQALGIILLGTLALVVYGQRRVIELEQRSAALKAQLEQRETRRAKVALDYAPRQKDPALEQALAKAEADRQALLEAEAVIQRGELGNTNGYAEYFRAFARSRVDGLWLTGVTIVGAGNEIVLQGRALQAALVPAYITGLGKETVLKGKSFARLDIAQPEQKAAPTASAEAGKTTAPFLEFNLQSSALQDAATPGALR